MGGEQKMDQKSSTHQPRDWAERCSIVVSDSAQFSIKPYKSDRW